MSKMFFGGMPTGPDVRKLMKAFAALSEGDEITHESVESVLEIVRRDSRYKTVTTAWRRQLLKDRNIELAAIANIGFRALTPSERVSGAVAGIRYGVRKVARSVNKVTSVETTDPLLIHKRDHMRKLGNALIQSATAGMREIEPPKAQRPLPRLVPKDDKAA